MEKNKIAVGIDLGGTNLRLAAVDENGQIRRLIEEKSEKSEKELMKQFKSAISKFRKDHKIGGIGISAAGPINTQKGIVLQMPNIPKIKNWKIKKELQRKFKVSVELENDANAALLGEVWIGLAKKKKDVLLLTLGTGVGGAALVNGKILRGKSGSAAEFGHIVIDPDGPECGCGKKGCLESFCGAKGILRTAKNEGLKIREVEDIFKHAKSRSMNASRVVSKFSKALSAGLGDLTNIFNPELIVLSGKISKSSPIFLPRVKKYLEEECFRAMLQDVDIKSSKMIDKSAILGVVYHLLKRG